VGRKGEKMLTIYQRHEWPTFTRRMAMLFCAWLALHVVTHAFVNALNRIVVPVLGLPLGIYIPMQAAIIVFAVMLFCFSRAAR
jgi:putative solute:sodium symporter small subunit